MVCVGQPRSRPTVRYRTRPFSVGVKHEILEKYLRAYLHVLKRSNNNLLFIDGFAGPGAYQNNGSSQPGSPIRALSLISSDAELAKRVTTVFIEKDEQLYESLQAEVQSFYRNNPNIRDPIHLNKEFREGMEIMLEPFEKKSRSLAPTFLFVDPCGVNGVYFDPPELHEKFAMTAEAQGKSLNSLAQEALQRSITA